MSDSLYPSDWNHDSQFVDRLYDVVADADCEWLQAVTELSFVLTQIVLACDDSEYRNVVAEVVCERLRKSAADGKLPGETVQ